MFKKEKNPFYENKDQISENLEALLISLNDCEEKGMIDEGETTYNEIIELLDETNSVDTLPELSEIITKAKVIETRIDEWYAKQGISNVEINWPQI